MIKRMAKAHINTLMGRFILASGLKINKMEKVKKLGLTTLNMMGCIKMVRKKERVVFCSQTVAFTTDNFTITRFQGKVSTYGLMEKFIKEIGKRIK